MGYPERSNEAVDARSRGDETEPKPKLELVTSKRSWERTRARLEELSRELSQLEALELAT